jgi:hypothetical protein
VRRLFRRVRTAVGVDAVDADISDEAGGVYINISRWVMGKHSHEIPMFIMMNWSAIG